MPEYFAENLEAHSGGRRNPPGEAIEERSPPERFGLWVSFYPFTQEEYLDIVAYWLRTLGVADDTIALAERVTR